jgi:branched-chain amino acid transport system ATP-binding protein
MSIALETRQLNKRFGGLLATNEVSLSLEGNELHAIIGPNGAGKTTLIGQLTGELAPDSGSIVLFGQDITRLNVEQRARLGLGRSYQISQICKDFTALENVTMAALSRAERDRTDQVSFFGRLLSPMANAKVLQNEALRCLDLVGLATKAQTPSSVLAHGEHRQLELAMALALQPRILLLDEPLAGMSQSESEQMIQLLLKLKGQFPILLIEHDMDAVFALADRISVLVYGAIIACDTPSNIRNNDKVKTAYLGDEVGELSHE